VRVHLTNALGVDSNPQPFERALPSINHIDNDKKMFLSYLPVILATTIDGIYRTTVFSCPLRCWQNH